MILRAASRSVLVIRGVMAGPEENLNEGTSIDDDIVDEDDEDVVSVRVLVELVIVAGVRGVIGPHGATGPFGEACAARGVLLTEGKRQKGRRSAEMTVR